MLVGLLKGTSRIKKLLRPGKLENYYLEWEMIRADEPDLKQAVEEHIVHLVLHSSLKDPGQISFTFPGHSLLFVTSDEELALLALEEERTRFGVEFVQMWSVPIGWEAPGIEKFLSDHRRD